MARTRYSFQSPEANSRPFGGVRRPWGHVSRHCVYCGKVGPRVVVAAGFAHRRCIPKDRSALSSDHRDPTKVPLSD